jgi:transcriptional regulator with XRE-family HTH domain
MSKANNSKRSPNVAYRAKGKSCSSMARATDPDFGGVIRRRRRELDLTQDELASRIETSTLYVGLLESGKKHPSGRIVMRLAEVLGLEYRKLFLLTNPHARALLSAGPETAESSTWEQFLNDQQLRRTHNISNDEMEMLSQVALLGKIPSPRELIHILNMVRHAVGK